MTIGSGLLSSGLQTAHGVPGTQEPILPSGEDKRLNKERFLLNCGSRCETVRLIVANGGRDNVWGLTASDS